MKRILLTLLLLLPIPTYAANNPANIPAVNTIAAMQALGAASVQYPTIQVLGYNAANDAGGGIFTWSPASTATVDSCTIFTATGVVTGRWIRNLGAEPLAVEMCGAYSDGTNATPTTTAWQKAFDYVAASNRPNQKITAYGRNYLINASITKASSFYCPQVEGAGFQSTNITYSPVSESPVFNFIGGSGSICGGGVSGMSIIGNANTVGCQWTSIGGSYCDINMQSGKMLFLWCNCTGGGFAEFNVGTARQQSADAVTYVGEYRISGGNSSFHGSGLGLGSIITKTVNSAQPILKITGANAEVYQAPLNVQLFNSSGALTLIANGSSNVAQFSSGSIDIEANTSNPVTLASGTAVYHSGSLNIFGGALLGNGIVATGYVNTKFWSVSGGGVITLKDAQAWRTQNTFTANVGLTMAPPVAQNSMTFSLLLSAANYGWSGTFSYSTDVSAGGACNATLISSVLTDNTAAYGAPAIGCTAFAPTVLLTAGGATTITAIYDVKSQ